MTYTSRLCFAVSQIGFGLQPLPVIMSARLSSGLSQSTSPVWTASVLKTMKRQNYSESQKKGRLGLLEILTLSKVLATVHCITCDSLIKPILLAELASCQVSERLKTVRDIISSAALNLVSNCIRKQNKPDFKAKTIWQLKNNINTDAVYRSLMAPSHRGWSLPDV